MWFPALRFALQSRSHAVRLRLAATPARVRAVGTNGVCRRGGRERARCRGGHVLPCGCKVRRVQKTQACDGSRPAGAGVDTGRGPLRSTVQAAPHSPPPRCGFSAVLSAFKMCRVTGWTSASSGRPAPPRRCFAPPSVCPYGARVSPPSAPSAPSFCPGGECGQVSTSDIRAVGVMQNAGEKDPEVPFRR